MKRRNMILLGISFLVVLSSVLAAALVDETATMPRQVISAGYTSAAVGEITLRGTLGQPLAGTLESGKVILNQGFWVGVESALQWLVNLPLILR